MTKTFVTNHLGENCYVLSIGHEAALIDCGAFEEQKWTPIRQYIENEQLTLRYSLLTHTHFDHIYGLHFVERDFGVRPLFHQADLFLYQHADETHRLMMGCPFPYSVPEADGFLQDGQHLELGGKTIEVIHTPGHTPGGICFYVEEEGILFSGDTLFAESIGRSDLPGGDFETEISSIRERLLTLPEATKVYCGHGPSTSILHERYYNPYI